jgi:hypothetical protein
VAGGSLGGSTLYHRVVNVGERELAKGTITKGSGSLPGLLVSGRWKDVWMGRPTQKTCSTAGPLWIYDSLPVYARGGVRPMAGYPQQGGGGEDNPAIVINAYQYNLT